MILIFEDIFAYDTFLELQSFSIVLHTMLFGVAMFFRCLAEIFELDIIDIFLTHIILNVSGVDRKEVDHFWRLIL